jgi:hypothetical protein
MAEQGGMRRYDPARKPDPKAWLGLAEDERIRLALEHHRRVRTRVPNVRMHAVIHAVVENQIALGDDYAVERTVQRLMEEGLDRHEAIHAVGSVLIGHLSDLAGEAPPPDPNAAYLAALQDLTADGWGRPAKD